MSADYRVKSYAIGIDYNGERIITEGCGNTYKNTFDKEGDYSVYVTAYNQYGFVDSNIVNFCVSDKGYEAGDCNNDGKVSIADLVLLQKYILGSENLTKEQSEAADINQDGSADVFDMVFM